jgi:endonuclease-3 related protein
VVDAYTRRVFSRAGMIAGDEPYESIRVLFEGAMPADAGVLGEFHALIVRHAKERCRKRPICRGCVVRGCAGRTKEE